MCGAIYFAQVGMYKNEWERESLPKLFFTYCENERQPRRLFTTNYKTPKFT